MPRQRSAAPAYQFHISGQAVVRLGSPHSGFSVDHSVYLAPHDTAGLQRLAEYILRCPFSLARVGEAHQACL
jgi:hypothetical protein